MQSYPVKPGHAAKVSFGDIFDACFDSHKKEGDWYCGAFGSMPQIKARYEGKKELQVDTVTDKSFALKVASGPSPSDARAFLVVPVWPPLPIPAALPPPPFSPAPLSVMVLITVRESTQPGGPCQGGPRGPRRPAPPGPPAIEGSESVE